MSNQKYEDDVNITIDSVSIVAPPAFEAAWCAGAGGASFLGGIYQFFRAAKPGGDIDGVVGGWNKVTKRDELDFWLEAAATGNLGTYQDIQQTSAPLVSPLILDLNRDGKLELNNYTFFDFNANGFHELATWID